MGCHSKFHSKYNMFAKNRFACDKKQQLNQRKHDKLHGNNERKMTSFKSTENTDPHISKQRSKWDYPHIKKQGKNNRILRSYCTCNCMNVVTNCNSLYANFFYWIKTNKNYAYT